MDVRESWIELEIIVDVDQNGGPTNPPAMDRGQSRGGYLYWHRTSDETTGALSFISLLSFESCLAPQVDLLSQLLPERET